MRKLLVLLAIVAVAAPCRGAMLKQDTLELLLEGGFDFENWKGEPELAILGGLGYFVQDDVEIGGFANYQDMEFDSLWGIGAFGEYNVDFGLILLPFVGARIAYLDGDDYSDEYFKFTLLGGIKWFLSENVAIACTLDYNMATREVYQKKGNWVNQDESFGAEYTDTDLEVKLGIRCFL